MGVFCRFEVQGFGKWIFLTHFLLYFCVAGVDMPFSKGMGAEPELSEIIWGQGQNFFFQNRDANAFAFALSCVF